MLYICKYIYTYIISIERLYVIYIIYTYIYTHTHTHTHIYIYIYITMIQTEKNFRLVVVWSYNQFIYICSILEAKFSDDHLENGFYLVYIFPFAGCKIGTIYNLVF